MYNIFESGVLCWQDFECLAVCPSGYLRASYHLYKIVCFLVRDISLPAAQLFVIAIENILRVGVGNLTSYCGVGGLHCISCAHALAGMERYSTHKGLISNNQCSDWQIQSPKGVSVPFWGILLVQLPVNFFFWLYWLRQFVGKYGSFECYFPLRAGVFLLLCLVTAHK